MKRQYPQALMILAGTAIALPGCATIISGTSQTVTVTSNPPGAHVRIGHQTGATPVTLRIPKGKGYPIEIAHGSDKRLLPLNRNLDPYTLLNIIPPLWPGFIVDAVTGAITRYDPEVVSVDFNADSGLEGTHFVRFME